FVRRGRVKPSEITRVTDVTEAVQNKGPETAQHMLAALAIAGSARMPDPDPGLARLGARPEWLKIYANMFPQAPERQGGNIRLTVDVNAIRQYLGKLTYPLYFLDYETMASLVPHFDGLRPYQQVPFQYSLHRLEAPGAPLTHMGYLHREDSNPARPL